jgi:hypothetical protein
MGCSAVTTVDLLPERGNAPTSALAGAGANTVGVGSNAFAGGGTGSTAAMAGNANVSGSGGAVAMAGQAGAGPARVVLAHRYDFSGSGTDIVDSINGMHGTAMGDAALSGTGQLTLDGDAQSYVKLPSWLLSSMTSASIVVWFTWHGGRAWQSVFNFGANASNTAAPSEDVKAEFFFTPLMLPGPGSSLHVDMIYGNTLDFINDPNPFPVDVPVVLVVVFDGEAQQISLYVNGAAIDSPKPTTQRLSELKDANGWLGQSQWAHDVTNSGNLRATFDEVRIYRGALSSEQVGHLVVSDPNAL